MTFRLDVDGEVHSVEIVTRSPETVLRVDGSRQVGVAVPDTVQVARDGDLAWVRHGGRTFRVRLEDPVSAAQEQAGGSDEVRAPMPGSVIEVLKAAGETVARGEKIMVIESMKLQTTLAAPRDGVLAEVLFAVGDTFNKDAAVARLEPMAGED
jgi:acetyl/propionyl-CoA carboxylase alpha subunit